MDLVVPILTIAADLFGCTAECASHVSALRENLECLRGELSLLTRQSEDVEKRVELAKQQQMMPSSEVLGWLQDANKEKTEVAAILQEGEALLAKKCLGRCWNISSSYKLGKRVSVEIGRVKEVISRGDFEAVGYGVPRDVVDELPLGVSVGLDSMCAEVCSCLAKDEVGVIGLDGGPGIGKTTLLKKINNDLLGTDHQFDMVIWVSMSRESSEKAAQEVIGNKLGIVDGTWPNRSQEEKAIAIFNVMKTKRFLLLFDDVRNPLNLLDIGVPLPDARNRSKVILSGRFLRVSNFEKVHSWIEVKPLAEDYAWSLFIKHLPPHALNTPDIEILARSMLAKCKGLPYAIVKAAQAAAGFETATEWQQSMPELENLIHTETSSDDEIPVGYAVGMDSLSAEVCSCLADNEVRILGLYGKRGIGKTTLMVKIHNGIRKSDHQFDMVIWPEVHEISSEKDAQEAIGNKLGIIDGSWESRSHDEKALKIFNVMKTSKFLLFLDNIMEPVDLLEIGVPLHNTQKGSKVIITSRFREICDLMKAERLFEVKPLAKEYAWCLFIKHFLPPTRHLVLHNPDIQIIAESILAKCKGLPSAIIKAGQASADFKTATKWQWSKLELEDLIKGEISLGEDDRFSLSHLRDKMPVGYTVGLDSLSAEVLSCLANVEVRILGVYGKREIGKTMLMKKINHSILGTHHRFDMVIWVTVSEEGCVSAAQEVIGNKLRIIDSIWPNRSPEEKAIEIFNVLKTKRFLLLLDNVLKPLDLLEIGVPHPDTQEARAGSKVIISARIPDICIRMKATRLFEVKPLAKEYAWSLFIFHLRTSALDHPYSKILAERILAQCQGLPSVIIKAGQVSADFETPRDWDESIQKLEDLINKEILSGIDDHWLPNEVADEKALGYTVGIDSVYQRLRKCLVVFEGGIIGLYGTGGVGKTTLMKKIYNEFSKTSWPFDTVIWVTLSNKENVKNAQEEIRTKLRDVIFNVPKTKRFLLLLDDVWQRIELHGIGFRPHGEIQNGSKVIITTRSQQICNEMEVPLGRQFKVEVLAEEEARALLFEKVGKKTLDAHPEIPELAEKMAERCKGLPLALVIVGRAMADKTYPEAWERAIEELENFPTEIPGMKDEVFHVLKFSYDSLKDDITKSCFIYYSFFPKGYEIRNDELIEHWIGQGFIGGDNMHEARRAGQKIIDNLKNACLFEEGDEFKECIKMHGVIHDMAIWVARECGQMMKKIMLYESLDLADAERGTSWNEAKAILLWGKNVEKLPKTPVL